MQTIEEIDTRPNIDQMMAYTARHNHLQFGNSMFYWRNNQLPDEAPHRRLLSETLDRVMAGEIKRLCINMPFRHWKTEEAVINLISRVYAVNPCAKCWHATYSHPLVLTNSRQIQKNMTDIHYQEFYDVRMSRNSSAAMHWETEQGGMFHGSTMAGHGVTGFGAGLQGDPWDGIMVLDDVQDAMSMSSAPAQAVARNGVVNLVNTRLNHRDTPVIFIQQRLGLKDATNHILSGGTGDVWDTLVLQGVSDTGRPPEHYKQYSHCRLIDYQLKPGALYPYKMSKQAWLNIRDAKSDSEDEQPQGALVFAAQVQQNPTDLSLSMFKFEWLKWYAENKLPPTLSQMVMRIDTAQKGTESSDHHGLNVFGHDARDHSCSYLLDAQRSRLEFTDLLDWIMEHIKRFKSYETRSLKFTEIIIEDANIGAALKSSIEATMKKERIRVGVSLTPSYGSKFDRAMEAVPYLQQGRIILPNERTRFQTDDMKNIWLLIDEFKAFNENDTHSTDDMLDPLIWEVVQRYGNAQKKTGWAYAGLRG